MAKEDNFIVAIELGSSKVTGLAGRKHPDGALQILAFAQEPSTTFIRKGRINNVSKMTQCVINIKDKLEKRLQKSISSVYVGIGGMGMHTVANTVTRRFDSKIAITQEIVDAMNDENRSTTGTEREILESVPQEFRLGTQLQIDPVGILSDSIEGHYLNIVANSSVREEIRVCFRNAGVNIADLPITVLALADAMLSEAEKRSGCVFIDMGSETTSVAVYKNNILRHLAVIPLGGANVNRDIMSLQVEDDEAEELKLKYGSAVADAEAPDHKPIHLADGRTVPYEEFEGLVEARMEEIILNVKHQIALSKYPNEQLIGGLIVTGGASYMKDIDKAFTSCTEFDKIRFVHKTHIQLRNAAGDFNNRGEYNAAIALIDKGNANCYGGPIGQPNKDLFEDKAEKKSTAPTPEELAAIEQKKAEEEARVELEKREEEARLEAERRRKEAEEKARQRKEKFKKAFRKVGGFFEGLVSADKD